jgi:mRNA-degrading endonuclease RelE of RelBE toxin-antitoxin system
MKTMETDPFQGDVKALAGRDWAGVFRRRIGSYRLLFTVDRSQEKVSVVRILLRSGKTYRR